VPPQPGQYAVGPPTSGLAIAALIVGIVSIIGVCCYAVPGLVLGIVAIVLGQKAKSDIRASQGRQAGEGMAKAGFIMGIVSVVLSLLAAAIFVALFALGTMSEIPTDY
jgi:hypothetical protein